MYELLVIAGGVSLILFGARFLRKGLDRLFGPKLGHWMGTLADSRPRAFATGLGIAVITPSSTTMSLLAVQSVQAGHLSARQMFALMLGADVGLTVMVHLIALQLDSAAPILILIGVLLYQFTKANQLRGLGQVILSLGFIFMAIGIIKHAMVQSPPSEEFIQLVRAIKFYPVVLALMAMVLAVGMQSSTGTIGLVIGLSETNLIDVPTAVAVVVGANVGLALNTLIVGWKQAESRRLGLSNLIAKVVVGVLVFCLLPWADHLLAWVPGNLDKKTAVAHTGFNVMMAILFLPLVGQMSRLVNWWIPDVPIDEKSAKAFGPRYITLSPIDGLAVATGQSLREILRVSDIVRGMLDDLWKALHGSDLALVQQVQERDDQVDLLDSEIKKFLTRLASAEGDHDASGEIMRQLRYINELETIGDVIDKNLSELVTKRIRKDMRFSKEGWAELDDFYQKVAQNMLIAETAFTSQDRMLAQRLMRHKERLSHYENDLRDRHFARLRDGMIQSHESSSVHLDLLTHLKRINTSLTHVAYAILQSGEDKD